MNSSYPHPDELSRKQGLERLRETNRQLELNNLKLDEILAHLEAEVRQQRRERLRSKWKIETRFDASLPINLG